MLMAASTSYMFIWTPGTEACIQLAAVDRAFSYYHCEEVQRLHLAAQALREMQREKMLIRWFSTTLTAGFQIQRVKF